MAVNFDLVIFLTTFAFILPAELPDKSFIMTLVLATKQPRFAVWIGASIAFGLQALIAVSAGSLLSGLPRALLASIVLVIFLLGAFILLRMAWNERNATGIELEEIPQHNRKAWGAAVLLTFGVVFTAEWGDITQIAAAATSASTGNPLSVGLGAWTAEMVVAGLGVWIGERIRSRLKPGRLHAITGGVMVILAIVAAIEVLTNV